MADLSSLAIRRPVAATMVYLMLLVVGVVALRILPVDLLPRIEFTELTVRTRYPDVGPEEVEQIITDPIENAVSGLPNLERITSSSEEGSSRIRLRFARGTSIDEAANDLRAALDRLRDELPVEAEAPEIFKLDLDMIEVVSLAVTSSRDLESLTRLLEDDLARRFEQIPGVGAINVRGGIYREIRVDLDRDRLLAAGLTALDVQQALSRENVTLPAGNVKSGISDLYVRALGEYQSVDQVARTVVASPGGRSIRVRDVAAVRDGYQDVRYLVEMNGVPSITLSIQKQSGANTVAVAEAVRREMEMINTERDDVHFAVISDQSEFIRQSIANVRNSALWGSLLAVAVLYFFLRSRSSTAIIALSIPISVIATFGLLYFGGLTLNQMTFGGLALGVGLIVDNAIVVLESIDRRMRVEGDRRKAALQGAGQVVMAVTASTATTLIVFLPLVVGSGTEMTTWLKEVGVTISIALACSLFSSLTLIPLMSAHLLKVKKNGRNRIIEWLEERYVRILGWTLKHRIKTFGLLVLGLVIGFLPFFAGWVDSAIFSGTLNSRLYIDYEFDDFHYKSQSEEVVEQVEAYLEANAEEFMVDTVYSYYTENEAGTTISLTRENLSDDEMKDLRTAIRDGLPATPGVRLIFEEDTDQGGSSTYFAVKLFGTDTTTLYRLADEAARRLDTMDGVEDVSRPRSTGRREIQVSLDRDRIAELGRTATDITQVLGFSLGGVRLDRFNAGDREIITWLALRMEDRSRLEDLRQIPIANSGGRSVLLGDVADFEVIERPREIQRENRKVRVSVRGTYEGEDWGATQKIIEEMMNAYHLPAGYSWSWNDRIVEQANEDAEMGVNFLLALVLVYLVMASLFESLTQPFAILFAIPFALPGTAWMLAITNTPFNLMAQIGLLILMGIVVNNGIVLIDHVNHFRREGFSHEEAILKAGRDRLRPILMTAATTIIGLLPLAIGGVNVSGLLYYPMARTVMGGLISSVALTLLVLPYISLGTEGLSNWVQRVWVTSKGRKLETAEAKGA